MKEIKKFLKRDYKDKFLDTSKDCLSIEILSDYAEGALSIKEKEGVELHLAKCYHCLDMLISIREGLKFYRKRRYKLKKENLFLIMAIICFILSFIFSRYFLQFLAATIILCMKWIIDKRSNKILIMIYEAWKKGGEKEAGRILKEIEAKDRINF